MDGLSNGFPIASGPCTKCGSTHADLGKLNKLKATHTCTVCGHKWVKSPYVLYSPLAGLGCSLIESGELKVAIKPTPGTLHSAQGFCGATVGKGVSCASFGNCIGPTAECSCEHQQKVKGDASESDHPGMMSQH